MIGPVGIKMKAMIKFWVKVKVKVKKQKEILIKFKLMVDMKEKVK